MKLFFKPQLISSPVYEDDRGIFFPLPVPTQLRPWLQSNISVSKKWVFRGMHHQRGSAAQDKLISVPQGEILDFVVDLRKPHFMESYFFHMKPGDQLLVPAGCAHGFLALQENTMLHYLVNAPYAPLAEINFDWKSCDLIKEMVLAEVGDESNLIISPKDAQGFAFSSEFIEDTANNLKNT